MEELAHATLERLREILRPMDGAQVLSVREDGFTLRFERVYTASSLGSVGTRHAYASASAPGDAPDEPEGAYFEGVVAEDDDFVYSGAGELDAYDDEGCGGEFDVDVYVVPAEERPALVDKLVRELRERAKAATSPRTLYLRSEMCPVTKRPRPAYFDLEGRPIPEPRPGDIVIDETK